MMMVQHMRRAVDESHDQRLQQRLAMLVFVYQGERARVLANLGQAKGKHVLVKGTLQPQRLQPRNARQSQ